MGILKSSLYGMCYAKEIGVCFKQTVTIGRQWCLMKKGDIDAILGGGYDFSYFSNGRKII
jgi:hypothetical protein